MSQSKSTRYAWPEFTLHDPRTSGPLTVFPIVGGNGDGADYILLADAVEKGIARVTEESDSGNIPVIQIVNTGTTPLLGIQGEEYVGAKQNRTLNITVLAGKGITQIPVTCVEQGRWDPSPEKTFSAGSYESVAMRQMKSANIAENIKAHTTGFTKFRANQSAVWEAVDEVAAKHGVHSGTRSYSDVLGSKHVTESVDDTISRIEMPAGTRGAVVAFGGRVMAADVFESPFVFERIWPRLLESYAFSAIGAKGTPPSLEAAESFLTGPAKLEWNASPSVGLGEDVRWEDKNTLATALVWEDRFVHTSVFGRGQ